MHRRFGLPNIPGDDYKSLSAQWLITTPDKDLFLMIAPSLNGPDFSINPMIAASEEGQPSIMALAWRGELPKRRRAAITRAYRDTLIDLLRPVCIRDQHINSMGKVDDDDPLLTYSVEYHPSCGTPMPPGLFGDDEWRHLCRLMGGLADGDIVKGRAALIDDLQGRVFDKAAGAEHAVKRLIVWAIDRENRGDIARRLGMDDQQILQIIEEIDVLNEQKHTKRKWSIIDECTDDVVKTAKRFIWLSNLQGGPIDTILSRCRYDRTLGKATKDLDAVLPGDMEFPIENMPTGFPDQNFVDTLRSNLDAAGRHDLTAWIDRTLTLEHGISAICDITMSIARQMKTNSTAAGKHPSCPTEGTQS